MKNTELKRKRLFEKAADKAWDEWTAFRNDMHKEGEKALKYIENNHMMGIVLAGEPYHTDPEVNHGIIRSL